jgi:hypothetical protein
LTAFICANLYSEYLPFWEVVSIGHVGQVSISTHGKGSQIVMEQSYTVSTAIDSANLYTEDALLVISRACGHFMEPRHLTVRVIVKSIVMQKTALNLALDGIELSSNETKNYNVLIYFD